MADLVRRNVAQRVIENLDAVARPFARILRRLVRRHHVMHRQPRIVDLHREARRDDAFVFLAQRFGDREQMLLLALVEFVLHRAGAARRRHRRNEGADRIAAFQRGFEIGDVLGQLLLAGIFDRPGAGEPRLLRAGMRAVFVEARERHVLARAAFAGFRRDRLKPGQPVGDVVLKARLRLLAVADDVDAELDLLVHDLGDRLRGFARERFGSNGCSSCAPATDRTANAAVGDCPRQS